MEKNIYYRLPCDQYGQPNGLIESHKMTNEEYLVEKKYDEENFLAIWFSDYETALWRANN